MRHAAAALLLAPALLLGACSKGSSQADRLDEAAAQSDPAAAAVLRNQADEIRADGSNASLDAAGGPAQSALANAGQAAATSTTPPPPTADRSGSNPFLTPEQRRANAAEGR